MKIAVLAIGTELTSGQILNRNGQWISTRLHELGVPTSCHLVVPDERGLIRQALDFCATQSDVLFVTGGLGPTTDDFTRDVISQWTGKKLVFHSDSWEHIQRRLTARKVPVREAQRQQCFYPEGAEVLFNQQGTANAFTLSHQGKEIYVLPGPPREIESVWLDFIQTRMQKLAANADPYLTSSWDCIGLGESEIAHLTESALAGAEIEKGYRVHPPYVEVKLSYFKSELAQVQILRDRLTSALAPYCVLRDGQEAAQIVAEKIQPFRHVVIIDEVTAGQLFRRLSSHLASAMAEKKIQFLTDASFGHGDADLALTIQPAGSSGVRVSLRQARQVISNVIDSPYLALLMKDREKQYFAEMALLFWMRLLS